MVRTVVFRVDALPFMGVGHLSRCLALAHALRDLGAQVHFVCRDGEGNANSLVEKQGFDLHRLPAGEMPLDPANTKQWLGSSKDADAKTTFELIRCLGGADWLVVDHYALDADWEERLRPVCRRILVIDDLADRLHDCDLLLDQNLRDDNPYCIRTPAAAQILLGPRYALLREEFGMARPNVRLRSGSIDRILVFFGGSDPTGETFKALEALRMLNTNGLHIDVVVGESNPERVRVEALCRTLPGAVYHCQVDNMAYLMSQADLAVGAAGVSSWERLAVGLPAVVVAVADNQMGIMQQLHKSGLAIGLGSAENVSVRDMTMAIGRCLQNSEIMLQMSSRGLSTVDAAGARKVVMEMERLN
jgi:UDP-2,4-diacetamido-2,4,6-trideoxy-beta-L-altropyranose hydrolase